MHFLQISITIKKTSQEGKTMELGQKLRRARQELGLTQRQLCGDTITRNMLSLIESGVYR